MILAYPSQAHSRKHGPAGYTDWRSYKPWLRDEFSFRCAYCLMRERWYPSGQDAFGIEHVKPVSSFPSLALAYDNLVYACNRCNARKRDRLILDPGEAALGGHLQILPDGAIAGLTPEGKEFIHILKLDTRAMRQERETYLRLWLLAQEQPGHHTIQAVSLRAFGFPDDLPDLAALRPPGNTRPEGAAACFYQLRAGGRLPATY